MEYILYYSLFCKHSTNILQYIQCLPFKDKVRFINLDKRFEKNGVLYVKLDNGKEIEVPKSITSVPSMILLNRGNQTVQGENDIKKEMEKKTTVHSITQQKDPECFSINGVSSDICSDRFSFLDMDVESLSAKGAGGIRQMHNYVKLDETITIETPPDTELQSSSHEEALQNKEKERTMNI